MPLPDVANGLLFYRASLANHVKWRVLKGRCGPENVSEIALKPLELSGHVLTGLIATLNSVFMYSCFTFQTTCLTHPTHWPPTSHHLTTLA